MTFTAGFLLGFFIGASLGTVVMAFFCGVSHYNKPER
jgi:hypothetical protein